jgi:chloride channel protein, CIC family
VALVRRAAGIVCGGGRCRDACSHDAGPDLAIVLMMELTGFARAAVLPLLLAVTTATLIARTIEPRSIYGARLSDTQVRDRQRARDRATEESPT